MELTALGMFVTACIFLMTGFPVAFALAGVALIFALIGMAVGSFDYAFLLALPQRIFGVMSNNVLIAVPLFIFMGTMLERARIAEDLLESMGALFGRLHGGLGVAVILVGALLAASTGIVGATVVTMGLISLPTMLKWGYSPALATGTISAAGTLGQIIPPSIVLILLGDVMANAYQQAQLDMGIFLPDTVSVGELFAGALIPGLLLVLVYIVYQIVFALLNPDGAPPIHNNTQHKTDISLASLFNALLPPVILIIAVLGSILMGVATPTEAAAVGATGTLLLAGNRLKDKGLRAVRLSAPALLILVIIAARFDLRLNLESFTMANKMATALAMLLCGIIIIAIGQSLKATYETGILQKVMLKTTLITSMVFAILIGAALFSLVFRGFEGDTYIHEILTNLPGGPYTVLLSVMLVMFLLGFFLDFIEITFIVVPIIAPILLKMGFDPVWLGIIIALNLQTSFLTPPFGFALFYLRGITPPEIKTGQIYRGVIPFVIIQLGIILMLIFYPQLITWLPERIFG